jgi:hypothetical protein
LKLGWKEKEYSYLDDQPNVNFYLIFNINLDSQRQLGKERRLRGEHPRRSCMVEQSLSLGGGINAKLTAGVFGH